VRRLLLVIVLLFIVLTSFSESKYTVSGYVKDLRTGEALIGAIVYIKEIPSIAASTNNYGFYSITLNKGKYTIIGQFIGYAVNSVEITLTESKKMDFNLSEKVTELNEVIVTAERRNDNVTSNKMGVNQVNIQEIKSIPAFMGEKDILKTIQLLPGIKPVGEGNGGFYVRGGGSDENLILLDEANVYNASHLLGFFSVFNSDAIKDITIYKGTMPAEYGGRLSSVLDISMNDGNNKNYEANGGIGLISSRLTIDGPIAKDKGSFIISGRRTYADLVARGLYDIHVLKDSILKTAILYFYDLNAKANYKLSENDHIYLSGYFGKDAYGAIQGGIDWGNVTATLRWNHLFNDKLFSNTSIIYSDYNYTINNGSTNTPINIISRIQDYNFKEDLQYFPDNNDQIKFGINSIYHLMIPGIVTTVDTNINRPTLQNKYAIENAIYLSDEHKFSEKLSMNIGIRISAFSLLGPGKFYTYDDEGTAIDSSVYKSGQFVKHGTFINPEPRLAINYIINDKSSIKAFYGRNAQNLHLLSNSTTGSPTDLWIPSSNNVKAEISNQISLGYFRNFNDNNYEFSAEIYYKNLQNQIDYVTGAQLNFNANVESQLIYGAGRAYGIELFLKKKYGRFNGWLGYTLSRSERKFSQINNGAYYPAKQDRTHDVSIVGIFDLSKKWTLSATWVYYTGNAVTFPSGKYFVNGDVRFLYTERNGYRMPPYHRLDLGATRQGKKRGRYESSWTFSVYNAYARDNAYSINFIVDPNDRSKTQAVQTTLFKIVPSVTYNFKF
jgi:hypothetical protein